MAKPTVITSLGDSLSLFRAAINLSVNDDRDLVTIELTDDTNDNEIQLVIDREHAQTLIDRLVTCCNVIDGCDRNRNK